MSGLLAAMFAGTLAAILLVILFMVTFGAWALGLAELLQMVLR